MGFMQPVSQVTSPSLYTDTSGNADPTLANRYHQQGFDSNDQADWAKQLGAQAAGTGPNAGLQQLQQGVGAQQAYGMALANSAHGLGVGNAMKGAATNAVGAQQAGVQQGQVLQARQQMAGQAMAAQAGLQKRMADLQAGGMSLQQAQQQALLEQQTQRLNAGIQSGNNAVNQQMMMALLSGAGNVATAAGGMGSGGGMGAAPSGPQGDMAWSAGPGGY